MNDNATTLDALSAELREFQDSEGLPHECAFEQRNRLTGSLPQGHITLAWLDDFIGRWDEESGHE